MRLAGHVQVGEGRLLRQHELLHFSLAAVVVDEFGDF
jgi:hypothetical protein